MFMSGANQSLNDGLVYTLTQVYIHSIGSLSSTHPLLFHLQLCGRAQDQVLVSLLV